MSTKAFRLSKMEQYILERRKVSVEELSKWFQLSMNTVRGDIQELEKMGRIHKVYGGALSVQNSRVQSFEERSRNYIKNKKDIAFRAAELVEEGDTIFIDSGTTSIYMVDYLDENKNITVLTHNLGVVMRAMKKTGLHLVCLSGELDRATNSFVSEEMYSCIRGSRINKAFFTTSGISSGGEVNTIFPLDHTTKKEVLKCNCEKYLLSDASKFGKATGIPYGEITDFDKILTDQEAEDIFLKLCENRQVVVELAGQREDIKVIGL